MTNSLVIRLVTFSLLVLVHGTTSADDIAEQLKVAYTNYKAGNYDRALPQLKKVAANGNPIAMNVLGNMYAKGQGTKKNLVKAEYWFVKSVENSKTEVDKEMLGIGMQFYLADRVKQDHKKAEKWFFRAEKLGNINAASFLGVLNLEIHKEYKKALYWFERAAVRNHAYSQLMVGQLYGIIKKGLIPRNLKKGTYWCRRALENSAATEAERKDASDCLRRIAQLRASIAK